RAARDGDGPGDLAADAGAHGSPPAGSPGAGAVVRELRLAGGWGRRPQGVVPGSGRRGDRLDRPRRPPRSAVARPSPGAREGDAGRPRPLRDRPALDDSRAAQLISDQPPITRSKTLSLGDPGASLLGLTAASPYFRDCASLARIPGRS